MVILLLTAMGAGPFHPLLPEGQHHQDQHIFLGRGWGSYLLLGLEKGQNSHIWGREVGLFQESLVDPNAPESARLGPGALEVWWAKVSKHWHLWGPCRLLSFRRSCHGSFPRP